MNWQPVHSKVAAGEAIFHNPLCGPSSESRSKWDDPERPALGGKAAVALAVVGSLGHSIARGAR